NDTPNPPERAESAPAPVTGGPEPFPRQSVPVVGGDAPTGPAGSRPKRGVDGAPGATTEVTRVRADDGPRLVGGHPLPERGRGVGAVVRAALLRRRRHDDADLPRADSGRVAQPPARARPRGRPGGRVPPRPAHRPDPGAAARGAAP